MADLQKIVEELSQLTVMQIADLTKQLEDKWGVKAAPVAVAGAAVAGAPAAGAAPAAAQTEFTCVLTNAGGNKIQVIKAIREITSLGLKEAKDTVDNTPSTVKEGISKAEAEEIKKKLEDQGAVVELK